MSAIFYLLYHGHYVRIVDLAGRSVYELVNRERATAFTNEAAAWYQAFTHNLTPEQVQIQNGSLSSGRGHSTHDAGQSGNAAVGEFVPRIEMELL